MTQTKKIEKPFHKEVTNKVEVKRKIAKKMSAQGYSVRQIMRKLNYKATSSVQFLLRT